MTPKEYVEQNKEKASYKNNKNTTGMPIEQKEQKGEKHITKLPIKYTHKGKNKISKTDKAKIKKVAKVAGFMTFAFTGVGLIWYCINKKS